MSDGIELHPEHGVCACLAACMVCGKTCGLVLLGKANKLYRCGNCNRGHLGAGKPRKCQACGGRTLSFDKEFSPWGGPVPGLMTCSDCQSRAREVQAILEAGGLLWRCSACNAVGVVEPGEVATRIRDEAGVPAPGELRILIDQDECPACGPRAGVK